MCCSVHLPLIKTILEIHKTAYKYCFHSNSYLNVLVPAVINVVSLMYYPHMKLQNACKLKV